MPEWISYSFSGIVGGLVAAAVSFGAIRADLRNTKLEIDKIRQKQEGMDDAYVTRREFEITMKAIREDIHTISQSVGAVRDFLLTRQEPREGSSEL